MGKTKTSVQKVKTSVQRVDLQLHGSDDYPVLYANHLVVNFTGTEFIVTVADSTPEPYTGEPKPSPAKLPARVLGRFAFNVNQWALTVESLVELMDKVRETGVLAEDVRIPKDIA
jgi:hypothetical protein